jgi:NAD(P)-dependent dehydrogenase (short-subunit alcohol dehydrogenase family)
MPDITLTVVTGGGRGIGAAICRRLAADGHDIVLTYRADADSAGAVAAEVRAAGRRALAVQTDTTDEASVAELFRVAETFGTIRGLVNNAGAASAVGRLEDNPMELIGRDLDVNILGVIACSKYAIAPMKRAGGGAIVNISSAAATLGSANTYVHYAAAKAAVDALTVGLSKELATDNIRVNAVDPGIISTQFHRDPDRPAKLASTIPMGRAGRPEEIAGAVAWLLSEDASYTTGTIMRVAGGH